ncbi:TetR family transcriptional regulator [Colidextribacter sp. OB.20]|uniref:TetR/AcrR family transcriptional regulator n=1 Tax=Colidextribacter sp. OB.20 TaxID=2304568 RepID=UPI00136FCB76|nr:TetR/AcrR family transcriptional regulator [Colidextribacter sp. OB.20]NBI09715.1 TetR family transcriptional regulator [Colidextribacter sp. OB.20]
MPNFTKKAIKETFVALLDERPLNRITVKDIVEACGINRNSFYYHFEDLPALLEEIIAERVQDLISDHPSIDSMEDSFDAALEFVLDHRRAVLHIYNSMSRDVFERYLMEVCRYVVDTYIDAAFADQEIGREDKDMLVRYHKCACFGHIIDWLNTGMKDDVSAYFHRVYALILSRRGDGTQI